MGDIFDAKIKENGTANKPDISNLVRKSDLNANLAALATKVVLKVEEDKVVRLQTFDLIYFLGKNVLGFDGFQNMFIYQPTLNTLELKKD